MDAWNKFKGEIWKNEINVEDFILNNYKEYLGDESFLEEDFFLSSKKEKNEKCFKFFRIEINF